MRLSSDLSPHPWRTILMEKSRVHIPNILTPDSAHEIHEFLKNQEKWNLVFNQDGKHIDIDSSSETLWDEDQRTSFFNLVNAQATSQFQYLYKSIPIYDIYHQKSLPGNFLNKIFEFLNGENFLGFMRKVLNIPDIGFADAQATCFSSGHFLTSHDDKVLGKNRLAAYVLNLTPNWNTNWGGALQFLDADGQIEQVFSPTFNAINVFKVPQPHSVSYVTPFAGTQRYSITGWLRAGKDPLRSD